MAVLFADGMDLYTATADLTQRYQSVDTDIAFGAAFGRFGGGGIKITNDDKKLLKTVPAGISTLIVGYSVFIQDLTGVSDVILQINNTTITNFNLLFDPTTNQIEARVGTGTTVGTFDIAVGVWHWISIKIFLDNSVGTIDVELDNVNVVSFTGDTIVSGSTTFEHVAFMGTTIPDVSYDDIHICDTTGGAPFNDILTDRRIDTLISSGAGDSTDFTPSAGSNFSNVQTNDGDTTYNESDVAADLDLYAMADMSFTPDVIDGVQVTSVGRKSDAGSVEYKNKIKTGTTEGDGATNSSSGGYQYFSDVFLVDPDTAIAWTESGVNGMQTGMEIV